VNLRLKLYSVQHTLWGDAERCQLGHGCSVKADKLAELLVPARTLQKNSGGRAMAYLAFMSSITSSGVPAGATV
jgi:hypothetical protein